MIFGEECSERWVLTALILLFQQNVDLLFLSLYNDFIVSNELHEHEFDLFERKPFKFPCITIGPKWEEVLVSRLFAELLVQVYLIKLNSFGDGPFVLNGKNFVGPNELGSHSILKIHLVKLLRCLPFYALDSFNLFGRVRPQLILLFLNS